MFEDREVEFNLGEGSDIDLIEGVEIAIEKMVIGEESRYEKFFQFFDDYQDRSITSIFSQIQN